MKNKLRTKFLVNFPIQYKIAFLSLFGVAIPSLLSLIAVLAITKSLVMQSQDNSEMIHSTLIYLNDKLFITLIAGYGFIAVLYTLWTMIFVHRIVGPLHRVEKTIDDYLEGKAIKPIKFRENDYFSSLAEKVNKLLRQ